MVRMYANLFVRGSFSLSNNSYANSSEVAFQQSQNASERLRLLENILSTSVNPIDVWGFLEPHKIEIKKPEIINAHFEPQPVLESVDETIIAYDVKKPKIEDFFDTNMEKKIAGTIWKFIGLFAVIFSLIILFIGWD